MGPIYGGSRGAKRILGLLFETLRQSKDLQPPHNRMSAFMLFIYIRHNNQRHVVIQNPNVEQEVLQHPICNA